MDTLCYPDLVRVLNEAIDACKKEMFVPPVTIHDRIKEMYTWQNVAMRTEKV